MLFSTTLNKILACFKKFFPYKFMYVFGCCETISSRSSIFVCKGELTEYSGLSFLGFWRMDTVKFNNLSYTGSLRILSGPKLYGFAVLAEATLALLWYNITGMGLDLNLLTQNQINPCHFLLKEYCKSS